MGAITAIILFFNLTACSNVNIDRVMHRGYEVEREILPHVLRFEARCKKEVKMDILFSDIDKESSPIKTNVIGYCQPFIVPYIHIDHAWWLRNLDYFRRESLIFHELGHCVLHKWHNDTIGKDGLEESMMHSIIFSRPYQYQIFREYYIQELCEE